MSSRSIVKVKLSLSLGNRDSHQLVTTCIRIILVIVSLQTCAFHWRSTWSGGHWNNLFTSVVWSFCQRKYNNQTRPLLAASLRSSIRSKRRCKSFNFASSVSVALSTMQQTTGRLSFSEVQDCQRKSLDHNCSAL